MYTGHMVWAALLICGSCKLEHDSKDLPINPALKSVDELRNDVNSLKELVLNYTQSIKDDFERSLISSFMIKCPNIPLCFDDGRFYKNYSFYSKGQSPACQQCSCADDCVRKHDCCISRYLSQRNITSNEGDHIGSQPERNKAPLSCKRTQIGVFKIGLQHLPYATHWIITQCPMRPGSIIWRKCRKFLSTEDLKYEKLHRPVTSLKTNESYQNEYCAKCFGEKLDDLVPWERVLFDDIDEKVDREDDPFQRAYDGKSMLSYEPPTFLKRRVQCILPMYRKCNSSGLMYRYDEKVMWACEKIPFTVPFIHHVDVYKNIFCLYCNNDKFGFHLYYSEFNKSYFGSDVALRPVLGVFAQLLRFSKPMEVRDYKIESRCPNEEIFSPILKQCLPVVCQVGYVQQGPKCLLISSVQLRTKFDVFAAVCTNENYDSVLFHKMKRDDPGLYYDIKRHLIEQMYLHDVFVTFNMGHPLIPSSSDICYPLGLSFFSKIPVNKVVMTTFYSMILKNISFNDKFALRHAQFKLLGAYYKMINVHSSKFNFYIKNKLYHVINNNHCPRVYLPNDYHINFTLLEACIAEYDVCFASHLMNNDDSGIYLCLDFYKQIINEYVRKVNDEISPETYLSIVSLSISSFFCLLTVTRYTVTHNNFPISLKLKMALSFSLFLANTLYSCSRFFIYHYRFCMVFGILSHYLWLVVLGFMSILSFDLFISIFSFFKLKGNSTFSAYIISNLTLCLIAVAIHIQMSFQASGELSIGYSKTTCFIENGELKFFTLVLPIVLMVVLNTIFLMAMIYCIKKRMIAAKSRQKLALKVILKISSITGVAWIFGFMYELTDELFFAHTHNVFSGCIGVFVFLSF